MGIRPPQRASFCWAVVSAVLLVGSCAAIPATASRTSTTAPPAPSAETTVPAYVQHAIMKWRRDGGAAQIAILAKDFTKMAAVTEDWQVASGCYVLLLDVHAAQEFASIPESTAEQQWSAALNAYARGAFECAHGADAHDDSILAQSSRDFDRGTFLIRQLTLRLDN